MRASPWIAGLALAGAIAAAIVGGRDAAARLEVRWQEEVEASLPAGSSLRADVEGRTVQISGTVASDEDRIALRDALRDGHPHLVIDDRIRVHARPAAVPPVEPARLWAEADSMSLQECQSALDEALDRQPLDFLAASAALTPESGALVDSLVRVLDGFPDFVVEIAGHADRQGSRDLNRPLSQARAEAIRAQLVQRGIDEERLIAVGYGESRPIADDTTESGRRRNRRIELIARGVRP